MISNMKVCVVMVNYNNSILSIDCCNSLLTQIGNHELTTIVVDNDSKQEEKQVLRGYLAEHPDIVGLFLKDNIGYFPAMVKGQELAYKKMEYDYMIVANNDLLYEQNFLEILSRQKFNEKVMVVSPDIIRMDGIHQNPHFVNRITFIRKFLYRFYYTNWYLSLIMTAVLRIFNVKRLDKNKPGYDKEQFIYMGFGACFILTKTYMKEIGILDNRTFLMGEEQLLTIQVEKYNGKILYLPSLRVHHMDSATFRQMPNRFAYECERVSYKLYRDYL